MISAVHKQLIRYPMRFQNIDYGTGTIKEVRITPCPEAAQRRPCILKKGTNVTIEVDFEPSKYIANNRVRICAESMLPFPACVV